MSFTPDVAGHAGQERQRTDPNQTLHPARELLEIAATDRLGARQLHELGLARAQLLVELPLLAQRAELLERGRERGLVGRLRALQLGRERCEGLVVDGGCRHGG